MKSVYFWRKCMDKLYEDDVKNGRVAPITETFDDLRKMLQEG